MSTQADTVSGIPFRFPLHAILLSCIPPIAQLSVILRLTTVFCSGSEVEVR
jgi:hypothetical protein